MQEEAAAKVEALLAEDEKQSDDKSGEWHTIGTQRIQ